MTMTATEALEPPGLRHDPKHMLAVFNREDLAGNGIITGSQACEVLRALKVEGAEVPLEKLYTFDDVLSLVSLAESPESPSAYVSAFMGLLGEYQAKSEAQELFEEAQRTETRIAEVRERELRRRQQQVKARQKVEWERIEKIQQGQLKQFSEAWNQHIEQFEKSSFELLEQMKDRHLEEIDREENALKQEVRSSPKYSKKVLELRAREKSLIKNKNYEEVIKVRRTVNEIAGREGRIYSEAQVASMDKKLRDLRKHQNQAMLALRDKIYNEKLALLGRRKEDTECLAVRIRNLRNEVRRKMGEEERRLGELAREELGGSRRRV